ncbi:hypothetical protein BDV18DRAFT_128396 [Aspergillus unguis]
MESRVWPLGIDEPLGQARRRFRSLHIIFQRGNLSVPSGLPRLVRMAVVLCRVSPSILGIILALLILRA